LDRSTAISSNLSVGLSTHPSCTQFLMHTRMPIVIVY
jgi:hypothetical protein